MHQLSLRRLVVDDEHAATAAEPLAGGHRRGRICAERGEEARRLHRFEQPQVKTVSTSAGFVKLLLRAGDGDHRQALSTGERAQ